MFKKNTAVVGFGIGHFINASTGVVVTTGTPTCKRTLDGTGGACANAAAYNTDGAVWEIDLAAGDMNADTVILSFTLTDCLPISYTIKTVTKLVSDLKDETMRGTDSAALASVLGAAVGATISADIAAVKAETVLIVGYVDTEVAAVLAAVDTEIAAIKAKTDNLPAAPADDTSIDTQLAAIAGYLDSEIAAIKAKTDNLPADPASESNINANETKIDAIDTIIDAVKVVTDKVATALELDGAVYRYTTNALEQAPSGDATVNVRHEGTWIITE